MSQTTLSPPPNRCRLVLILNAAQAEFIDPIALEKIFGAGDVASIIFTPQSGAEIIDEATWQSLIEPLVKIAQNLGVAAILTEYTRTAGRLGADGFQMGQDIDVLREAIQKYTPKMMVGAANIKSRHNALMIGELQPDYIMFGKPGGDIRPEPHPKNIDLGRWWTALVEIPVIVLGGNEVKSVIEVANTGAEFVALGAAIFSSQKNNDGAIENIRLANQLLDKHAPKFNNPHSQPRANNND